MQAQPEPAAALFHDRARARAAAEKLAGRDIHAVIRDGMREAEHGFLAKMGIGALIGAVVTLPIAIAFTWWAWQQAPAVLPVVPTMAFVVPPIVFCGVYLGIVIGLSLGERAVQQPEVILIVSADEVAGGKLDLATIESVVREEGGEPIKNPSRLRIA